jgi:gluconokinase
VIREERQHVIARGHADEVSLVGPRRAGAGQKPIGLVHEGRGLQRLARPFPAHAGGRQPPELLVDERRDFIDARRLAFVGAHEPIRRRSAHYRVDGADEQTQPRVDGDAAVARSFRRRRGAACPRRLSLRFEAPLQTSGAVTVAPQRPTRYAASVVVVLIGAAGAGKTTVGKALAAALGWRFVDGDDYHAPASIAKMRAGVPLSDADRAPWLASLHCVIAATLDRREHIVIACSALRDSYRRTLQGGLHAVRFVYLEADESTLRRRLAERPGHFAGPALAVSQLATLEAPVDALTIDATRPPEQIVDTIGYEFGL